MAFSNRVIDGGDVLLKVNGKVLGCSTSHTITISSDIISLANKEDGGWADGIQGTFSWSVSTDALFNMYSDTNKTMYRDLVGLMLGRNNITVMSSIEEDGSTFIMQGAAIIVDISQSSPDAANASYSVTMQGRGRLSVGADFDNSYNNSFSI